MEVSLSENRASESLAASVVALIGRAVSWLTLAMVLLTFSVVFLRYGLNQGWIWLQESITYLHASVFMIATAWAFQQDEHVRVDIFYRDKSPRHKGWVNLLGTLLFLVPFSIFLLLIGWNYVAASWQAMESSREAGGLPLVFLLKTLILLMPVLLLIQSYSTIRACISIIKNDNQ